MKMKARIGLQRSVKVADYQYTKIELALEEEVEDEAEGISALYDKVNAQLLAMEVKELERKDRIARIEELYEVLEEESSRSVKYKRALAELRTLGELV
jgi:putative protein kinase ArgK-like GTPase of G3E family